MIVSLRAESVTKAYDEFLQAAQEWGAGNMWEHALEDCDAAKWELKELNANSIRQDECQYP